MGSAEIDRPRGRSACAWRATADVERFELYTDCAPLVVWVTARLTARATAAAESRLRAARLFVEAYTGFDTGAPILGVAIGSYSLDLSVMKMLLDPVTDISNYAFTWGRSWIGPGDDDGLFSKLSQGVDEFLAAYLRVNGAACQ